MRKLVQSLVFSGVVACFLLLSYSNLNVGYGMNRMNTDRSSDFTRVFPSSISNRTENVSHSAVDSFMQKMGMRMKERKEILRDNCKKFGLRHHWNAIPKGLKFLVKYKSIFCRITKAGSTHWADLFREVLLLDVNKTQLGAEMRNITQIRDDGNQSYLSSKDWVRMIAVREPMERLVSAFRSKLAGTRTTLWDEARRIQREYGDKADPHYESRILPDFNTFINYLVLSYPASMHTDNRHWEKYSSLCQPCDIDFDVIAHQETIEEDSEYVLRTMGAPPGLKLKPPYRNKTDDDMVLRYYSSVKPRVRVQQLYNLLLDDYLLFGYPRPKLFEELLTT